MTHQTPLTQDLLRQQVAGLQRLAAIQRSARLGLRAVWLFAAGLILGWGVDALWGVLPGEWSWVLIGLALALHPLITLARSFAPSQRWVWKMDRRLGFREQVSTAFEVVQTKPRGGLSEELVAEVNQLLPQVRERMLQRGWFIKREAVSFLIVALLGAVLLGANLLSPYSQLLGDESFETVEMPELPDPLQQPFAGLQPAGEMPGGVPVPGEGEASGGEGGGQQNMPSESGQPGQNQGDTPGSDPGAMADALRKMGSELSEQAGTYDLGQALENLDLNGAADAIDELKGQLDELSPESRQNLADAMNEAAGELEQAGEQELAQDLRSAAEALENGGEAAGEALGEVGSELRELAGLLGEAGQAGAGAGQGENGGSGSTSEPFERLTEEGGEMELPLEEEEQSGLLDPARPEGEGEGTARGGLDSSGPAQDNAAQSPLLPNSFLWKWRDVVSEYFER